jgi:hypothetical protein
MTATTSSLSHDFPLESSTRALGPTMPQRIGQTLWGPMLAMAFMAFPIALLIGFIRSTAVSDGTDAPAIAGLGHIGAGLMFIGFAAVLAAVSFAIARILGVLRVGGGSVQETAGTSVKTLKMPTAGKVFIGLMVMATMAILIAVLVHFGFGLAILAGDATALAESEAWFSWLEGVRRIGVAVYLISIAFGLATIIEVLRFQARRIQELPTEVTLPAEVTLPVENATT